MRLLGLFSVIYIPLFFVKEKFIFYSTRSEVLDKEEKTEEEAVVEAGVVNIGSPTCHHKCKDGSSRDFFFLV